MFYPANCQGYIIFNKTVVFIPAHRFIIKRCDHHSITNLIDWMFNTPSASVYVVAAGRYDAEYINYYTGKKVLYLYASSVFSYTPPSEYSCLHNYILFAPFNNNKGRSKEYQYTKNAFERYGLNISLIRIRSFTKGNPYSIDLINKFKAVVLFPYAVLSYYIADIITSNIPFFVPSPKMLAEQKMLFDFQNRNRFYCGNTMYNISKHVKSKHIYSPEDNNSRAIEYWAQYSMFYTPCSIIFESYDHLAKLVDETDYAKVYKCNLKYRDYVIKHNERIWSIISNRIERNRRIPGSIKESLQYFGKQSIF